MLVQYEFDLRHVRAMRAVADELHFGRAAERLAIAQPALSRTIQQLERSLGCLLVERSTRSVALTKAGSVLAERAAEILDSCDAAVRDTSDVAAGRTGRLRVGFSGTTMLHTVAPLLRRFSSEASGWAVEVAEAPTTEQIRLLASGELDVGFFLSGLDLPENIETTEVAADRACIGVPRNHPLAGRTQLSLGELGEERLILFPRRRNPRLYDEIVDIVTDLHTRRVEIIEASSRQVAAGLVAAGQGVATFTEAFAAHCGPEVVLVPQVDPERIITTVMGWRRGTANPLLELLP